MSLINSIEAIVRKTGEFITGEARGFNPAMIEEKGYNDLVSYVDKESEKMLVEELSGLLPEAGIIGEEGNYKANDNGLNWIIDPLDGTTNFVHGLPVYSISVALTENTEPVAGVVFDVCRDELYKAETKGGAYCNNEKIHVSQTNSLPLSLLATGFPYQHFDKTDPYFEIIKELMQNCHGIRRMGSAAIDLAYTACGRFEGFFEYSLNAWDVAAGILLIKEAGGTVTDFSGGDNYLFGKEILGAGPVHPDILRIISKHWNS